MFRAAWFSNHWSAGATPLRRRNIDTPFYPVFELTRVSFESFIRPFACLACFTVPLPVAAEASLPAPVPRIDRIFGMANAVDPRIFTTETALVHPEVKLNAGIQRWAAVHFWDATGDGPATVRMLDGTEVVEGESFAHGNRIYLGVPRGVRIVDRDPAVPPRHFPLPTDWNLVAVNADHLILARTRHGVSDPGRLRFIRTSDLGTAGEAEATDLKIKKLIAREDRMIISGERERSPSLVVGSAPYPRLVLGKTASFSLSRVPGHIYGLQCLGPRFAIMQSASSPYLKLVDWDKGPAATPADLAIPAATGVSGSTEAAGDLYLHASNNRLFRVVLGTSPATLEPIAVPGDLQGYALTRSSGPFLYFFSQYFPEFLRLHPGPGRQLEVMHTSARESDGVMRFTVRLDAPAAGPVSFRYETRPRGAEAGIDYTPVEGTVTLAPGQTEAVIEVPLLEDFVIERPETLELRLTGCSGAWCDRAVAAGKIVGSGARLLSREVIPWEVAKNFSKDRLPATTRLELPGGSADARELGFATFSPMEGNHGRYFFAWGNSPRDGEDACCQFDAHTGELLEALPYRGVASWKIENDQLLFWNEREFDRWGFYDGFPVPSFAGKSLRENGGPQQIVALGERCHLPLEFEAGDPGSDLLTGPLAMSLDAEGYLRLSGDPPDDSRVQLDQSVRIPLRMKNAASGTESMMEVTLPLADDDSAYTTRVPAGTAEIAVMAAHGNRLWTGSVASPFLSGFTFADGRLAADATVPLPKDTRLIGGSSDFSFDGSALGAGLLRNGKPAVFSLPSAGKASLRRTDTPNPSAIQLAGPYLAVGKRPSRAGESGRVLILDAASGKQLKVLEPPDFAPGFGHSLASGGGFLWVGCLPGNTSAGRVFGYSLDDLSPVRTIDNPEPVTGSSFASSIAADDRQLVIGDPGNSNLGAVWVFNARGDTVLKRLGLDPETWCRGLGARVATRGGRVLASCGPPPTTYWASASSPVTARGRDLRTSIEIPWVASRPVIRAVLWDGPDAQALHLHSPLEGYDSFGSGKQIALLDDCAVYTSMANGPGITAGLQVYIFPQAAAAKNLPAVAAAGAGSGTPVWPGAGAAPPLWSFQKTGPDALAVKVDLGATPAFADDLRIEWSGDLQAWIPLKSWRDSPSSHALEISWSTKDRTRGFFRLRATGE
jgi:hypothetical protein